MIMITGGAFQGKTEFVKTRYGCEILNGENCGFENVMTAKCVKNYHLLVKRLLESRQDAITFTERLCAENSDLIVIINEIGCGVIPIEKSDRIWREQVGRAGCIIAKNSDTVFRLIGGIPITIKGAVQ